MPDPTPKAIVEAWVSAFNEADVTTLASLYSRDAVNHQVTGSPVEGREAIRQMFEKEFAAAKMTCIVEHLFEDGEWAILEWRDPLGLRGCGFFHVIHGKIHCRHAHAPGRRPRGVDVQRDQSLLAERTRVLAYGGLGAIHTPVTQLKHNIDLHAVTGTGGGAEASLVVPGKEVDFEFRAIKPGLYVYHCAMAPVGMHIANGMYGLILVEPKEGLPPVDREFYVMQSEFYTTGTMGEKGFQGFDIEKAVREEPEYVVFNGRVGALTGAGALEARPGETVRLFVGNGGPNLTSSFHVIGEVFDTVYGEGGTLANQHNVQTTVVPPGGSAMVQVKIDVPGKYTLVDHAIFRAFNKGAIGILNVEGEENPEIYAGQTVMKDYLPDGSQRGTN